MSATAGIALRGDAIRAALTTRAIGRALRLLPECGSTNDEAAAWARADGLAAAPHGAVVIADAQQRGRGRLGRAWHSPPGENLYFSAVLRPPITPPEAPPLTLVAGVALADAVRALGAAPALKWPNDLLLDGKKVAGILTEMATAGARIAHVIVGIGLNLNTHAFPPELPGATSLAIARGAPVDPALAAAALCNALERWYLRFLDEGVGPIVAAWKAGARFLGTRVKVQSGRDTMEGVAEDLAPGGALLLRLDDGRAIQVIAGDVFCEEVNA